MNASRHSFDFAQRLLAQALEQLVDNQIGDPHSVGQVDKRELTLKAGDLRQQAFQQGSP
jgi:hypothetical protein